MLRLLLLLLLIPSLVQAAITYDAVSSSVDNETLNTVTFNHVVGGDYLAVCAQARGDVEAPEVVSSVTANGTAMTLARADAYNPEPSVYFRTELWVLPAPTVGTIPITITWAGTPRDYAVGSAVSLAGVTQSTTADASAGASGIGTTLSAVITTTAPNAWIVDCPIGRDNAGITVGAGQTARANRIVGVSEITSDGVGLSTVNGKASPGAETMDWTQLSSQWVLSAIALSPAGGASPPPSSPSQATLAWTNGTDGVGVTGATIRRCTGDTCAPATTLTTIAASNGSAGLYVDSTIAANTSYCYSVNNFDAAGNQSPYTAAACTTTGTTYRTTLATDTFNRADSTDLGTSWDAGYTGRQNCQIISGRLRGTVVASGCTETYNGVTTPDNQWVQFTVPTLAGSVNSSAKALIRWANAPTLTGYRCSVENNTSQVLIQEITGGGAATLTSTASFTHLPGDIYRCEAYGTALRLYQIRGTAETLLLSTTDATITSGKTGLDLFTDATGSVADVESDTFAMGGFDTTPSSTPTVTGLSLDATGATLTFGTTLPSSVRATAGNTLQSYVNVIESMAAFVPTLTQTISDTFDRGDGATLGANWTAMTGHTSLAIASNVAQAGALASSRSNTHNTAVANDQYAQVTLGAYAATGDTEAHLLVRHDGTTRSGYSCTADNFSSHYASIVKWTNNTPTYLNPVGLTTPWTAGDILTCIAVGNQIIMLRNGVGVTSAQDVLNTYPSGSVGLRMRNYDGVITDTTFNNFAAGTAAAPYRYTRTWIDGLTFACFYPIDSLGIEHAGDASRCASLVGIVAVQDTTPPTLTNCTPTAAIPFGSTSWTIACTLDKPATAKYDTTDAAYASLANSMTTESLIVSATVSGLTNNSSTTYYLRAQSTDSLGETHPMTSSATITVTVPSGAAADTTVPSTVTNLVATLQQTNAVLQWTAATDNAAVAGYQVYQSFDSGCTTYNLAGDPVPTTTTQLSLLPSTVYCWKVRAIDTSNNLSAAFSNIVTLTTATIPDVTPPSDMSNLQIIGAFTASLLLTWDSGTDDRGPVTTSIERCLVVAPSTDCSNFSTTTSAIAGSNLSVSLAASSTYCFRGRHSDQAGNNGAYSNSVCGTTLASGIDQPRIPISPGLPREAATTRVPR